MPENGFWLVHRPRSAAFVVTGYIEGEAVAVAEPRDGILAPAGRVRFGLGRRLWPRPDGLRVGAASRAGVVPVRPELLAGVRYFGRYRTGWIRDAVLLSVG
jgi:hypothetical protein